MTDPRVESAGEKRVEELPRARVEPASRSGLARLVGAAAWLLPLVTALIVGAVFVQARAQRGPRIVIRFADGAGIKAGDPVVYRGVRVGQVLSVEVAADLSCVVLRAGLTRDAEPLAREGTRFWVVRPEVSLTKVSGLETIVGPRYVEATPAGAGGGAAGAAAPQLEFVGVEGSPLAAISGAGAAVGPGDLMLVLRGDRARSVNVGSPVLFRGVKVGHVLNWDLDPTGRSVDVHVAVYERYAHLVRANSRWWSVSGFGFDFGLVGGLSLRTSSLESLISGGVSFATPERPSPGARAMNGQVFELVPEAEKDWLEWSPDLSKDSPVPARMPSKVGR